MLTTLIVDSFAKPRKIDCAITGSHPACRTMHPSPETAVGSRTRLHQGVGCQSGGLAHTQLITGLLDGQTYTYYAPARMLPAARTWTIAPFLSDTVRVMPTDLFVYLPLGAKAQ